MLRSTLSSGKSGLWQSVLIYWVSITALNAQIADFSSEKLTFTIHPQFVEMSGSYFFTNRAGQVVSLPIVYPFCVNAQQAFPDSIKITTADGRLLNFQRRGDYVSFAVPLAEKGRTEVVIYFRQPVNRPQFEYILTSTRSWRKPLDSADFSVIVPQSCSLTDLSLPFVQIDTTVDFCTYRLHFEEFYPDKNLKFSW